MQPGAGAPVDRARTAFAMQAISLADQFAMIHGQQPLRGAPPYRPELSAPDGPSTGGGKQSLQHIRLVPTDGSGTVVVGTADQVANCARLRRYHDVAARFAQRFRGETWSVAQPEYDQFLARLQKFFHQNGLRVEFEVEAPRDASPQKSGGSSLTVAMIAVVATAAILVGVWALFLR